MPPQLLEGETLGKRHKYFNSRVNEAVKSDASLSDIVSQYGDSDAEQLFKIEVANRRRDVEYVVQSLKSADMVVVSRAIRGSGWLVVDEQYSHIVEPHFLHDQLLPHMTTRAACKFMLHVRLTLRDERRVESYFKYYEHNDFSKALKWLPNCSAAFIETTVQKHQNHIQASSLKRLCRKCPSALYNVYKAPKNFNIDVSPHYTAANYVLKTELVKYLDAMETLETYNWPSFGPKHTALIMKHYPERIINNFVKYSYHVHFGTVAKYMKPANIASFLIKINKDQATHNRWFQYNDICPFIKRIPKNIRYEFIKQTYIDKVDVEGDNNAGQYIPVDPVYQWYRHVPFDIAFSELNKLIKNESSPDQRASMLTSMLTAAGRDPDNIYKVLEHYHKKHVNEPFHIKKLIIDSVLSDTNILRYDDKTWKMLNEIFHNMEVYMQSIKDVQNYLQAIIVYKVVHKEHVPEIVETKFHFNTLKKYKTKLTEVERENIFEYLFIMVDDRMNLQKIGTDDGLSELLVILSDAMHLLFDWNKDLGNYPSVLNKLKMVLELIRKKEKKISLEHLYNRKKSWKRYLFKESILISPKDKTLVNVLKHDPTLLHRYPKEIEAIRCDDAEDLQQLLPKLKIYWPDTLAAEWLVAYQKRIKEIQAPKALVRGLINLLSHSDLLELLDQYAPDSLKWSELDEVALSLRKNFAQLMYRARPQPPPSAIAPYTQGDYLQFALPSLNSILYNTSPQKTPEHLSYILSGPISLQKHGIRMTFTKLQSHEVKDVFSNIWKTSKNAPIRAVIFKLTFKLLTHEKNNAKIEDIWGLLDMFIENLSNKENKQIYTLLSNVDEVPIIVRAKFCIKSYKFLKSLPSNLNCGKYIERLVLSTSKVMDTIQQDFVKDILLEFIEHRFVNKKVDSRGYNISYVFAAYLLCTDSEEEQNERYMKVMTPLMNQVCMSWDEVYKGERVTRSFFERVIQVLSTLFKEHIILAGDKYIMPIKLFIDIQKELESKLSIEKIYDVLTYIKQMVCYLKHYNTIKNDVPPPVKDISEEDACEDDGCGGMDNDRYKQIWIKIIPLLAEDFVKLLKQDMEQHFPTIQILYAKATRKFYSAMRCDINDFTFEKEIMKYNDFVPALLLSMKLLPDYCYHEDKENLNDIRRAWATHPSKEVRLHYYKKYIGIPLTPLES